MEKLEAWINAQRNGAHFIPVSSFFCSPVNVIGTLVSELMAKRCLLLSVVSVQCASESLMPSTLVKCGEVPSRLCNEV